MLYRNLETQLSHIFSWHKSVGSHLYPLSIWLGIRYFIFSPPCQRLIPWTRNTFDPKKLERKVRVTHTSSREVSEGGTLQRCLLLMPHGWQVIYFSVLERREEKRGLRRWRQRCRVFPRLGLQRWDGDHCVENITYKKRPVLGNNGSLNCR